MATLTAKSSQASKRSIFQLRTLHNWLDRHTQPHPSLTNAEDRRRARLLAYSSFILAVILSASFILSVFTSVFFPDPTISLGIEGTLLVFIFAFGFWFCYRLSVTERYKLAAWIGILNIYLFMSGFILLDHYRALSTALVMGYAAPVLMATIFLDLNGTIRLFIGSLTLTVLALVYQRIPFVNGAFVVGITAVFTLLVVVVALLREQDLSQVERLRQLEAKEAVRLRHELELARKVQLSMLPKVLPDLPNLELAAYSQPAFEASGDFYDVFILNRLQQNNQPVKLGIVVCDVAGKGVSSALVMSATRAALRAEAENVESPALVLRKVNEMLAESVPMGLFVTLFYGIYSVDSRELRFASAGHPHPYYCVDKEISELQNFGMPLGLVFESEYEDQVAILAPGASLFIYTDGLVEALNGQREMYGFEMVQQNVARHAQQKRTAKEMIRHTVNDLETFLGGENPHDDVTIVVMRLAESNHGQ